MKAAYGVMNKATGLFFGGFDADKQPKWVSKERAYGMDEPGAKEQAALFACFGIKVQKKPVAI